MKAPYTISDYWLARNVITEAAEKHGISEEEYREELQNALDIAWNAEDSLKKMFDRVKPTLEDFVLTLSDLSAVRRHWASRRVEQFYQKSK